MAESENIMRIKINTIALLVVLLSTLAAKGSATSESVYPGIWIEAESFGDKGGWVVDQQYMDLMGSPYIMAHGMGKPVQDAVAKVAVPDAGKDASTFPDNQNFNRAKRLLPVPRAFLNSETAGEADIAE